MVLCMDLLKKERSVMKTNVDNEFSKYTIKRGPLALTRFDFVHVVRP